MGQPSTLYGQCKITCISVGLDVLTTETRSNILIQNPGDQAPVHKGIFTGLLAVKLGL